MIADEAGVTRGTINHHFASRAAFMAEVMRWVFERETEIFRTLIQDRRAGARVSDWPALLWDVFSRPSGVAVLEILVASRSDPELAELVTPMQAEVELTGAMNFAQRIGARDVDMPTIRMVVWAIRGMTLGRAFTGDAAGMEGAVAQLARLIERAAPSGSFEELAGPP
ncbi:TetR/AcrR family transcriptional regulator [Caulobacter sp. FWC26]|nr:TetR/AcrR family transcriptional regulator [Caulobacter sp. 3R27C2-B]AZS23003.1 TetR/AcrR family transcriptional regulator [Caulobacter sp. FWC26]